ncbi:hypothetical protein DevBK_02290 [Devosia sp. BK]|uniref:hypothetical protein n=1 Tax=Devosia sp. BK TaxID=2871706 RepID=UPI00293A2D72|nr:hypothetical protein [Devosia sp. BK]MDV3250155.1 hypothetical protein [Devosia sp. BK]
MSEFEARFQPLFEVLSDPEALFHGADMRDDLLALEPLIPDRAAEARLFRELAVLEAKRDELVCLDHADRALAAQAETGAIDDRALYFMHMQCGDVGTAWKGGPRTEMHLQRALELHAKLERPIGEAFFIRLNLGVYNNTVHGPRRALDAYEPLLADAEQHYGADNPELRRLVGLMGACYEALGDMENALALGTRSYELSVPGDDPGPRVSAMLTFGKLNFRSGRVDEARRILADMITFADANCTPATRRFARDETRNIFPHIADAGI